MKIIEVISRKYGKHQILVDDDDFERIRHKQWCVKPSRNTFYADSRHSGILHRFILGITDPNIFIDHKDGNGLNNTRENLRFCTKSQNCANRTPAGKSKYLGVSIDVYNRFRARIHVNGKSIHLGMFVDEISAAMAYDTAAQKYHKEFANVNFKSS